MLYSVILSGAKNLIYERKIFMSIEGEKKDNQNNIIPFATRVIRFLPMDSGSSPLTPAEVRRILLGAVEPQEPKEIIRLVSQKEEDERRVYGKPWL